MESAAPAPAAPPTLDWRRGPIVLAGNWEPLIFRRRINLGAANRAELYAEEHTPAFVRRLGELGVNLFITHYFKGFGLQAEAPDIAQARQLLRLCHERGIRVGAYIGDTIILETMLAEEPEAVSWHQVMPDASPVYYGGTQTFRFKWCFTNPAYLTYMMRVLTQAVRDGFDLIHLDNFLNKPEPMSCHCRWCRDGFRAFLNERLSSAERQERLGFADVSHVLPPIFSTPLYIQWQADVLANPLLQEWVRFRCQVVSDRYRQLGEFCRELNPAIAMECNPTGIWGENTAYMRSVEHAALLPHGDFFWDESPNPHGRLENGALCTHIRSMKMGERFQDRVFYYSGNAEQKLAEGLAYNHGCIGMIGAPPGLSGDLSADRELAHESMLRPYLTLLRERPDLFCTTRSTARIAVYRNTPSLAYNGLEPHLQAILAEEVLLEDHLPFDIILTLEDLDYRAVILPGTECLAEDELDRLKAYVADGGRLILTGNAARYDHWRRQRPDPPFGPAASSVVAETSGKGVVIRVPPLQLPAAAPVIEERAVWDEHYRVIDARFWVRPRNAPQLLRALGQVSLGGLTPFLVRAPRTTMVESRQAADGHSLYLHIIHYANAERRQEIAFRVRSSGPHPRLSLIVPGQEAKPVEFRQRRQELAFTVVTRQAYAVVEVTR